MASETFLDVKERVKFSLTFLRGEDFHVEKSNLRGLIADVDDSSRECCYYRVSWNAPADELKRIGVEPNEYIQSDHLARDKGPTKPKKPTLKVSWSKKEKDLMIRYPSAPDGSFMHVFLHHTPIAGGKTLREELIERGYDIETLKFSIERK